MEKLKMVDIPGFASIDTCESPPTRFWPVRQSRLSWESSPEEPTPPLPYHQDSRKVSWSMDAPDETDAGETQTVVQTPRIVHPLAPPGARAVHGEDGDGSSVEESETQDDEPATLRVKTKPQENEVILRQDSTGERRPRIKTGVDMSSIMKFDDFSKLLKNVLQGKEVYAVQHGIVERHFNGKNAIKGSEVWQPLYEDSITLADLTPATGKEKEVKTIEVKYSAIHLAIIYKSKRLLNIIYDRMRKDVQFCRNALCCTTNENEDALKSINSKRFKVPDEIFHLTSLQLAVRHNEEALVEMLQIAKEHSILWDMVRSTDQRGFNLLHFAAFQKSTDCLNILLGGDKNKLVLSPQEMKKMRMSLFKSRTRSLVDRQGHQQCHQRSAVAGLQGKESPLHTARSEAMLDFLLKCENDEQHVWLQMLSSRDERCDGARYNVLRAYLAREDIDLAKRFLDHHVNKITDSTSGKQAIFLDLSPMIGEEINDQRQSMSLQEGSEDQECGSVKTERVESGVIREMMPLTSRKKELLLHPVVNTFIMIKYNSYIIPLLFPIIARLLFSVALTHVALNHCMNPTNTDSFNTTQNQTGRLNISQDLKESNIASENLVNNEEDSQGLEFTVEKLLSFGFLFLCLFVMLTYTIFNVTTNFNKLWGKSGMALRHEIMRVIFYLFSISFLITFAMGLSFAFHQELLGVLVLLSWLLLGTHLRVLMLGKYYNIGFFVRMLYEISTKVIIFMILYSCIFVGFTLSFYIMMPEQFEEFQFTRVLVMTIGEIDYNDSNFATSSVIFRIMFWGFAILCPIIINNLLIGLTVSDVEDLIKNANMSSLQFKIRFVDLLDESWLMKSLSYIADRTFKQSHLISYASNSLEVAIRPQNKSRNILSSEPVTNIFEVHPNADGQREVGEAWSYLGVTTYVPVSMVEEAERAIRRLAEDESGRCTHCGRA